MIVPLRAEFIFNLIGPYFHTLFQQYNTSKVTFSHKLYKTYPQCLNRLLRSQMWGGI